MAAEQVEIRPVGRAGGLLMLVEEVAGQPGRRCFRRANRDRPPEWWNSWVLAHPWSILLLRRMATSPRPLGIEYRPVLGGVGLRRRSGQICPIAVLTAGRRTAWLTSL